MTEESAWYLVARDADKKPVAIVHFRFDLDEEEEVLYWCVTSICNQLKKAYLNLECIPAVNNSQPDSKQKVITLDFPFHLLLPDGQPPPPGRILCTVLITMPSVGPPSLIELHSIDKEDCS